MKRLLHLRKPNRFLWNDDGYNHLFDTAIAIPFKGSILPGIVNQGQPMKLIRETKSKSELDRIRTLLESRGIPVHVGEENQHRLGGHAMFFLRYRLHVVLDFQYEDAVKLLEDENHEVAEPVDIEEFRNYERQAQPAVLNRMIGWLIGAVIVCSALLYLMYQVVDQ